jgi:amidase
MAREGGRTDRFSRRTFLKGAAVGGAALATGLSPVAEALGGGLSDDREREWFDATVPELQRLMASGELTSRRLTSIYLGRIERLNPMLGAVIETNPHARRIAERLDEERRRGHLRGPLHGIPVLLKDNIATDDAMETTAGSLALVGSTVPRDAKLVAGLRKAGAVILGKANLSEWANFRGFIPDGFPLDTNFLNGWSARGGFTYNPYLMSFDPCGSSSGSAVAPVANLCAVAVGTETDGSIVCPSGNNFAVGLKPTVGLVSQAGIIPIAHSQDTAGPMGRSVADVAFLLNAMKSPFGRVAREYLPRDYTRFLDRDALRGARIGIDRRQFLPEYFGLPDINAVVDRSIDKLADAGAVIIDPVDPGDPFDWFDAEFTVLLNEFKRDIARYLSGLGNTGMRTLADLIAFNQANCENEMKYFGQEIFEISESFSGDLTDPDYVAARRLCLKLGRRLGIDKAIADHQLDAILSPSYAFGSSGPAVAGYPMLSVPAGISSEGRPAGIWLSGGFLSEPTLIALGYAIEKTLDVQRPPRFKGDAPAEPPDAGLCGPTAPAGASARRAMARRRPTF